MGATNRVEVKRLDEAWQALIDASPPVHRYFLKLTGDRQLADELMQETLIACYRGFHRFRGEAQLSTWMIAVGRRKLARERARRKPVPLTGREAQAGDPLGRVEDQLLAEQALALIRRLPSPYNEVLMMRAAEGMSYREIGLVLGEGESWARVTCLRARRKLMELMEGGTPHG